MHARPAADADFSVLWTVGATGMTAVHCLWCGVACAVLLLYDTPTRKEACSLLRSQQTDNPPQKLFVPQPLSLTSQTSGRPRGIQRMAASKNDSVPQSSKLVIETARDGSAEGSIGWWVVGGH